MKSFKCNPSSSIALKLMTTLTAQLSIVMMFAQTANSAPDLHTLISTVKSITSSGGNGSTTESSGSKANGQFVATPFTRQSTPYNPLPEQVVVLAVQPLPLPLEGNEESKFREKRINYSSLEMTAAEALEQMSNRNRMGQPIATTTARPIYDQIPRPLLFEQEEEDS